MTAAALLFAVAIGAFATSKLVFIKELGLGTALAVLIDASVIRALLVPSLMELLGKLELVGAAPLRRLHARIGLHEARRSQPKRWPRLRERVATSDRTSRRHRPAAAPPRDPGPVSEPDGGVAEPRLAPQRRVQRPLRLGARRRARRRRAQPGR